MTKSRDLANAATALNAVTATEIGYVDGVTSAIQTQLNAKQAVVSGVNDTEIGYLDGVTSAIQTQLDAKTAKSTLSTTGDIYYASSANTPARLGIGSTGNVLTVASGIPSWAAPAGGGKVLQVVSTTYSTQATSSSGTYADTGVSLSITPSSASSKVLILLTNFWEKDNGSGDNAIRYNLVRGATQIHESYLNGYTSTSMRLIGSYSLQYLDSPNTTSSTTYKTQFKNFVNFGTIYTQVGSATATMILMEIGA